MTFSAEEVLAYRREKDEAFRSDSDSPIPAAERAHFGGLRYFPPDKKFYVPTKLVPDVMDRWVDLATSDGDERKMLIAGQFELRLDERVVRLRAYRHDAADDTVFIPFRDATAPEETYGAGRYLDVPHRPSQLIFLDLNYAYNPYCAYDEQFSCPFPPVENRLNVPIRAGEKKFHADEEPSQTGSNR